MKMRRIRECVKKRTNAEVQKCKVQKCKSGTHYMVCTCVRCPYILAYIDISRNHPVRAHIVHVMNIYHNGAIHLNN